MQCRLDTHQKKLDEGKQALGTMRDEHKEVNAKLCRWLSGSDEAERENTLWRRDVMVKQVPEWFPEIWRRVLVMDHLFVLLRLST